MRKNFWDKRIPTLLGLFMILIGTVLTTFLANKQQLGQVNAVNSDQPQNVRITNVTSSSFSVSYTTDGKTTGSLNYGQDKELGLTALDQRDKTNGVNNYYIHSITADNLSPKTKYYFTITSGQNAYMTNGEDFEVTTGAPLLESPESQNNLKGSVTTVDATIPDEAIIYLTLDNAQVVSVLTDKAGNYNFDLSKIRTSDLESKYTLSDNQIVKMLVLSNIGNSNIILSISQANNVPLITLSKDYDFTNTQLPQSSPSATFETFPSFSSNTSSSSSAKVVKILSPQKDESFSDQQPIFNGIGLPNQTVQITIHSDEQIQTNIKTDSSGNWSYKPDVPLSPGTHTITIVTKNSLGIFQTLTQSFVVYAQETQVESSPSPTLTPTPTDVLLIETSTVSATPTQELPASGNPSIITLGIMGILITFSGGLLFLLTRGGI